MLENDNDENVDDRELQKILSARERKLNKVKQKADEEDANSMMKS